MPVILPTARLGEPCACAPVVERLLEFPSPRPDRTQSSFHHQWAPAREAPPLRPGSPPGILVVRRGCRPGTVAERVELDGLERSAIVVDDDEHRDRDAVVL